MASNPNQIPENMPNHPVQCTEGHEAEGPNPHEDGEFQEKKR